jgi:hypothetical protein
MYFFFFFISFYYVLNLIRYDAPISTTIMGDKGSEMGYTTTANTQETSLGYLVCFFFNYFFFSFLHY